MKILTRHLIRAHVGPFFFALSALTGLLFLNAVAREMERLAGKGLPVEVILDFLVLSLPHTVALTLPMAVLVAVLYAFSEMASANEITAMRAGGISPIRILRPLLLMGVLVASVMLYFNDIVLPEANHRLKNLLLDINRKSPTFILEEQVVNRIQVGNEGDVYFLRATSIDNDTNRLEDVEIMSRARGGSSTTRAEWGVMAFNESRTDLYLTLHDGVMLEVDGSRPGGFQQSYFTRQIVPMRGVGNELDRRMGAVERSEREMGLTMLQERAEEREAALLEQTARSRDRSVSTVMLALGLETPDTANAAALERTRQSARSRNATQGTYLSRDHLTQDQVRAAGTSVGMVTSQARNVASYRVEIHKKLTLAFACIVFVLLGAPLATRFPRGGLGLVIAASSLIFAVYWMGLIGGEDLAERGLAPPWLAMWIPNLVFLVAGLLLFRGMGRETATGRGGGWDELAWAVRDRFVQRFGKGRGQTAAARAGEA